MAILRALHRPRRAGLDRRGVPGRRPAARGRSASGETIARNLKQAIRDETAAHRLGRRRELEARRQGRVRHAQARRPDGGRPRDGGRVPGAAAGAAAVGRGAQDGGDARQARGHHDRRAGRARPGAARAQASARTATTCSASRAARTTATSRGSRPERRAWARSTPTTRTPPIPTRLRATLLQLADAVAARLRAHGVRARTVTLKYRDEDFRTTTHARTLKRGDRLGRRAVPRRGRAVPGGARPAARAPGGHLRRRTSASRRRSSASSSAKPGPRRPTACATSCARRFGDEAITRASLLGRRERRNPSDKPPR